MSKYILVFGSLRKHSKRGFNYQRFGEQIFIKEVILNGFEMYSLTHYPAIKRGEGRIKAELHLVSEEIFRMINAMEVNAGYTPIVLNVEKRNAVIYLMDIDFKKRGFERVESGDWD